MQRLLIKFNSNEVIMKKLILFSFLTILFVFSLSAQEIKTAGLYIVSPEGNFEAVFPAGFGSFKKSVTTEGKESSQKLNIFTMENERGACLISYNEYDPETIGNKSVDQMLKETTQSYIKNNAKLLSSKNIKLGSYKGKSVTLASKGADGNFFERFDVYVINSRLYQVGFVGYTKEEMSKPDILDYFKSFNIFSEEPKEQGYYLSAEDEGFEILLPPGFQQPEKKKEPIKTDYGNVEMTLFTKEALNGACLISVNEYPEKLFADKQNDKILDDAFGGVMSDNNEKIISKGEYYLDDMQGISFITIYNANKVPIYSKYHFLINKPKLYQILYKSNSLKSLESEDVKEFFRSFRIK
jgi:hypothetical protein